MSDPWMKFYAADWRSDTALRDASIAARGLWIDLISIMHDAEPYGHLVDKKGRPMPLEAVSKIIGTPPAEIKILLDELLDKEVARVKRSGVVYSLRMERDEIRRRKNRDNGKKGGNPALLNHSGKSPPNNPSLKAKKPEARSQILEEDRIQTQQEQPAGKPTLDNLLFEGDSLRLFLEAEEAGDNTNFAYLQKIGPEKRKAHVWFMLAGLLQVHGMALPQAKALVGQMKSQHDLDDDDFAAVVMQLWKAQNIRAVSGLFRNICERVSTERRK